MDEINAAGQMPVTANSRLNPNLLRQRTYPGRNLRETWKKVVDTVRHHSQTQPQYPWKMLEESLSIGNPVIFNTDQGVQFTNNAWIRAVEGAVVQVSMDGKGRCFDNIIVERLWWTVKYEAVYLRRYSNPIDLREGLKTYFSFYNERRPHQS